MTEQPDLPQDIAELDPEDPAEDITILPPPNDDIGDPEGHDPEDGS